MRIATYREHLANLAESAGYIRSVFEKTPTNFAHWRWQTLYLTLVWLMSIKEGLQELWEETNFHRAAAAVLYKEVHAFVLNTEFWNEACIVYDIIVSAEPLSFRESSFLHSDEVKMGGGKLCIQFG